MGQVPILVVAATLAVVLLPTASKLCRDQGPGPDSESKLATLRKKLAGIDFLGASLLTMAIIGFMLPLAGANRARDYIWTVVLLSTSAILLAAFVVVENQYAIDPIVHPAIMRNKDAMASYASLAFQAAAHIGVRISCHPGMPTESLTTS